MKHKFRAAMSATALCLAGSVAITGLAATEHWNDNSGKTAISDEWKSWKTKWETVKTDYEQVALTPGADETQMNYAWYSKTGEQAKVRISTSVDMTNTVEKDGNNTYEEDVKEFTGTSTEYKQIDDTTYYANKVTVTGLKANTTYYYQRYLNGAWTDVEQFTTGDPEQFSFLYVGDPQIGASKGQTPSEAEEAQSAEIAARNDAFSWNNTLTQAMSDHPEIDFMVSAGDQINNTGDDNGQECEYAGFLAADAMGSLPVAATIGNHDSKFANYQNHFNVPNPYTEEQNATPAGNDYYYSYGDALFIVLNTNNYNCADHDALIKKAVASDPDAIWRVVVFHQDIYGSGYDHSDSDGIVLRTQLTTIMDENDIDVELQGHDHTYSRSYLLSSDGQEHTAYNAENIKSEYNNIKDGNSEDAAALESKQEFLNQNLCYQITDRTQGVVNKPEGVLYMEANSSTGSKYYNLISTQQDYIAQRSQTWTPTYSVIDVTKDTFTVNTYDVNTGAKIDEAFTITKKDVSESTEAPVETQEATTKPTEVPAATEPVATQTTVPVNNATATETPVAPTEVPAPTATVAPTQAPATATQAPATATQAPAASEDTTTTPAKAVVLKKISFSKKKLTIKVGAKKKLAVATTPKGASFDTVAYTSSKKKVATVSKTGVVKGKKAGKTTITAKVGAKKATCQIVVTK